MSFLFGILGCMAAIVLFTGGILLGYKLSRALPGTAAPSPSELEQRRLAEEQAAFHTLQNYSAERAYGVHGEA